MDYTFDMTSFISSKLKSANSQLFRIRKSRNSLTFSSCKTLVSSLVLSIIDYCNILLINLPTSVIHKLIALQKYAVRVIFNIPHREWNNDISITGLMKELNWLPIPSRIKYKLLVLTHTAFHHNSPAYLADLIKPSTIADRSLRSCHLNRLDQTVTKSSIRSFAVAAPSYWNQLSDELRAIKNTHTFKNKLKSHLLDCSFEWSCHYYFTIYSYFIIYYMIILSIIFYTLVSHYFGLKGVFF